MIDALLPLLTKLGLMFLGRWMDSRAAAWGEAGANPERVKAIEVELFSLIEQAAESEAGKKLLRSLVHAVVDARFPNDPTTATWG